MATARLAAILITAPNSSSINVHGTPAWAASSWRSASARTVIAAASSGITSACIRHITTAPYVIALNRL
jgi:hypothetical protein